LLHCIESLYRDRIAPTLGEIRDRLCDSDWSALEANAALTFGLQESDRYIIVPPSRGALPQILLRHPPSWFEGWVSIDDLDTYSEASWKEFKVQLQAASPQDLQGGICCLASQLKTRALASDSCFKAVGQLRNLLRLALGRRGLLAYNSGNGNQIETCLELRVDEAQPTKACDASVGMPALPVKPQFSRKVFNPLHVPTPMRGSHALGSGGLESKLLTALRARPWPDLLRCCGTDKLRHRRGVLRKCVESLYRDCLEPTLGELNGRLRECGWSSEELQAVPSLCAWEPEEYRLTVPAEGEPMRILLRTPPQWFAGWVSYPSTQSQYSPDAWEALALFLLQRFPTFRGGVHGAAQALRQEALPHLQHLRLGELRDLVCQAVFDRGFLTYDGDDLKPNPGKLASVLHEQAAFSWRSPDTMHSQI